MQSNVGDKSIIIPHNSFLFIPADHQHKSIAITNTRFLAIYLNSNSEINYLDKEKSGLVTPFLKILMLLLLDKGNVDVNLKVITNLLAVFQDQIIAAKCYEIPLLIPKDRRFSAIFLQLQRQPNLTLTLSEWALRVGTSPRTLSRLCTNEFGLSLALLETKELEKNKSILEVASDLGYQSDSAYIYAFKKMFFQTPSQYRKSHLMK